LSQLLDAAAEPDAPPVPTQRRHLDWWLIGIVVAALALRLGWVLWVRPDPPVSFVHSGDQFSYWYYGNEIAAGRGYVSYVTHQPTAYYPIGYPALLAALFWFVLHTPIPNDLMLSAELMHVAFGTATVPLVYLIGERLFDRRVALVAAGLYAFYPNAIFEVASLQLETTFVFLCLAALAVIVSHDWSKGLPSRGRLLAFGFTLGLSVLVRPFSVWFLAGLFIAALTVRAGLRKALAVTLVPAAVVVAMSIPWIIRNEIRMHAFVVTSTNTGDTLCLDRNSTAFGGFRFSDHDGCVDPNLPEVPRNAGNTRKAIQFVIHHPGRELLQIARRANFEFAQDHEGIEAVESLGNGPILSGGVRHLLYRAADWYFFVTLSAAVAGLPLLFRREQAPERRLVLVSVVSLVAIPLLLWGNPRFHVPLLPFAALLGAAAALGFAAAVRALVRGEVPERG